MGEPNQATGTAAPTTGTDAQAQRPQAPQAPAAGASEDARANYAASLIPDEPEQPIQQAGKPAATAAVSQQYIAPPTSDEFSVEFNDGELPAGTAELLQLAAQNKATQNQQTTQTADATAAAADTAAAPANPYDVFNELILPKFKQAGDPVKAQLQSYQQAEKMLHESRAEIAELRRQQQQTEEYIKAVQRAAPQETAAQAATGDGFEDPLMNDVAKLLDKKMQPLTQQLNLINEQAKAAQEQARRTQIVNEIRERANQDISALNDGVSTIPEAEREMLMPIIAELAKSPLYAAWQVAPNMTPAQRAAALIIQARGIVGGGIQTQKANSRTIAQGERVVGSGTNAGTGAAKSGNVLTMAQLTHLQENGNAEQKEWATRQIVNLI